MPSGVGKPPKHEPAGCGDGLWGFRILRGWGGCAAGSIQALAAAW
jgi:hypothetical protein